MTVLLELEPVRPSVLDGVTKAVQAPDAGVAAPGEHEPPCAAHPDHLVVDDVGCHAHEREVAASAANDLVPRRERDQMGEPLECDGVAVATISAIASWSGTISTGGRVMVRLFGKRTDVLRTNHTSCAGPGQSVVAALRPRVRMPDFCTLDAQNGSVIESTGTAGHIRQDLVWRGRRAQRAESR